MNQIQPNDRQAIIDQRRAEMNNNRPGPIIPPQWVQRVILQNLPEAPAPGVVAPWDQPLRNYNDYI